MISQKVSFSARATCCAPIARLYMKALEAINLTAWTLSITHEQ
jgi:hypothetical protein